MDDRPAKLEQELGSQYAKATDTRGHEGVYQYDDPPESVAAAVKADAENRRR